MISKSIARLIAQILTRLLSGRLLCRLTPLIKNSVLYINKKCNVKYLFVSNQEYICSVSDRYCLGEVFLTYRNVKVRE